MGSDDGSAWAVSSARSLARRLRRERQRQLGFTRAQAIAHRERLFRRSVELHWQLCSKLGLFASSFSDAIKAAELLQMPDIEEYRDGLVEGNWARHAPPPESFPKAAPIPGKIVKAHHLESFREDMYDFYGIGEHRDLTDESVVDRTKNELSNNMGTSNRLASVVDRAGLEGPVEKEAVRVPVQRTELTNKHIGITPPHSRSAWPWRAAATHGGAGVDPQQAAPTGCGGPPNASEVGGSPDRVGSIMMDDLEDKERGDRMTDDAIKKKDDTTNINEDVHAFSGRTSIFATAAEKHREYLDGLVEVRHRDGDWQLRHRSWLV